MDKQYIEQLADSMSEISMHVFIYMFENQNSFINTQKIYHYKVNNYLLNFGIKASEQQIKNSINECIELLAKLPTTVH